MLKIPQSIHKFYFESKQTASHFLIDIFLKQLTVWIRKLRSTEYECNVISFDDSFMIIPLIKKKKFKNRHTDQKKILYSIHHFLVKSLNS